MLIIKTYHAQTVGNPLEYLWSVDCTGVTFISPNGLSSIQVQIDTDIVSPEECKIKVEITYDDCISSQESLINWKETIQLRPFLTQIVCDSLEPITFYIADLLVKGNADEETFIITSSDPLNAGAFSIANGVVTYLPVIGATTFIDTAFVQISDANGNPSNIVPIGVMLSPCIVQSVVNPDTYVVPCEQSSVLDVVNNDTIQLGSYLEILEGTNAGTLMVNPDNTISFSPQPSYSGTFDFTYQVVEPGGKCVGPVTVTVTVEECVDCPEPLITITTLEQPENVGNVNLVAVVSNPTASDVITVVWNGVNIPAAGFTYNSTSGLILSSFLSATGLNQIVITVTNACGSHTVTDTILTIEPGSVDAMDDTISTTIGTPVTFDIIDNDINNTDGTLSVCEINGTAATFGSIVNVANGMIEILMTGEIKFTPDAGFTGVAVFNYTLCSTTGETDTASVDILVGNPCPGAVTIVDVTNTCDYTLKMYSVLGNVENDMDVLPIQRDDTGPTMQANFVVDSNGCGTNTKLETFQTLDQHMLGYTNDSNIGPYLMEAGGLINCIELWRSDTGTMITVPLSPTTFPTNLGVNVADLAIASDFATNPASRTLWLDTIEQAIGAYLSTIGITTAAFDFYGEFFANGEFGLFFGCKHDPTSIWVGKNKDIIVTSLCTFSQNGNNNLTGFGRTKQKLRRRGPSYEYTYDVPCGQLRYEIGIIGNNISSLINGITLNYNFMELTTNIATHDPTISSSNILAITCTEQTLTATLSPACVSPSYQWYKDGVAITGETGTTTVVIGSGLYKVVAMCGSCTYEAEITL